ncbi:hypothetical protein [Winogradskyella aquimaris]|uniref:ATP-grasp domain-containing protein n=1 Tax=Winogradskyella aquimaris TaxID=864074 RepID=A0ABU5ELD4_9FLAO|nr:hypothetical protein [Winogradskyella aquimaris]MDY2587083.1 hypothetical protein [Winogradskyella aquimaris]
MDKILIVGSNNNAALAIAQDLGNDYKIICFGFKEDFNKVQYSRFLYSYHNISKVSSIKEIEDSIVKLTIEKKINFIIPTNDRFTLLLSRDTIRSRINNVIITTPEYKILINGIDKLKVTKIAQKVGLKTPLTYLNSYEKISKFPVYMKSRISWDITEGKFEKGIVKKINNHVELRSHLQNYDTNKIYIQNQVFGNGWGLEVIAKNGILLNYFAHLRLRESNPKGGYSSAAKSIIPKSFYLEKIKLILKELNWTGVAMFEFKGDYQNKDSNLIEMNCRFWGSLPVALHSGNRFPYKLISMHEGKKINQSEYNSNIKVRWLQADIIHFIKVLTLKNRKHYNIPSPLVTFKNVFFKKMKGYNYIHGDWRPGFYEITIGFLKKIYG